MEIVLIAAAVLPAAWLLIRVYRADRLEKEPVSLLLSLIVLGVFSTALAGAAENYGEAALSALFPEHGLLYNAILYFAIVALSEEGFKYLLLKLRTWNNHNFNCSFDGVVYSVFVSLGFALWENISYVTMYGFSVALVRAVTAVPGHACFGVFMGVFYSLAKSNDYLGNRQQSGFFNALAVIVPVLLHGAYDYLASMDGQDFSWTFIIFVLALFAVAFLLVNRMSKNDHYLSRPWRQYR